jgi:hypothetical protein
MTTVTIWERFVDGSWAHNHISNGHDASDAPTPIDEHQRKTWKGGQWRKVHGWKNFNRNLFVML